MKNLIYLFLSVALLTACGDSGDIDESKGDSVKIKGYEELDLTPWGFEMSLMVPNADMNGEPDVVLTERGALEIVVGTSFGIEIMFGEGNMELLKTDLKEDLVFVSDIVTEEADLLVYTQNIPNSEIKTLNHFFYKKQIGADTYEIRDIMGVDYSMEMIEKMVKAVKTIQFKALAPLNSEAA